jgi:hypothetical protein
MLLSMGGKTNLFLKEPPLDVLERARDTSFALSEPLDIIYCNSAWDRFAQENGGSQEMQGRSVISKNLLDFVTPELRGFYSSLFARARAIGQPVDHDYECSTASAFRLYRMRVYPLAPGHGFVVLNSLRVEHPHDRIARPPDDAIYTDSAGLMHMCANCRRTRRTSPSPPDVWDWVPTYLDRNLANVSHGICPVCLEYYYGPFIGKRKNTEVA